MTWQLKAGAALLALLASGLVFRSWLAEHDARLKAEQTLKADATVEQKAADDFKAHLQADQQRDAQSAELQKQLTEAFAKLKTPQQQNAYVQKELGTAATVTQPASTTANPNPAPETTVSLPILTQKLEACDECQLSLASAQATVASKQQEIVDLQASNASLQNDVKTLKVETRSGWRARLWDGVKVAVPTAMFTALIIFGVSHSK